MAQETEQTKIGGPQLRLPPGVVLRPPVSLEELSAESVISETAKGLPARMT